MIAPEARSSAGSQLSVSPGILLRLWQFALFAAVLFLALVNQPYAPRTWFDEGSHLHVPKTLVQYGVYADISAEGFRYYGPTVGVGPTVMLPIAAVFKLFGIELLYGRLVVVAYLLIALAAFYALGRQLHNRLVALLALTLLIASRTLNYDGIIEYGRQVLGEVPGLAFLFLGAWLWLRALRAAGGGRKAALFSALAGLAFGLALVTKNQFVLIVPPTLALVALLDWRYYRVGTWALRIIPPLIACACFGVWMLAQFQFLGPGSFSENIELTRKAAGGAIFVFNLRSTLRAGYYLLRPDLYGGLLIPALVYALWRARHRTAQGLAEAFVALLISLWLTWFVGASLGWPRYAFPAVAFGALVVARALVDLIGWLWQAPPTDWRLSRGGLTPWLQRLRGVQWLAMIVAGYTLLAIALPIGLTTRGLLRYDDSAQQMAGYLKAHVPATTIIETWEPELGVLTDHRYHYPPISLLDTAVRQEWLGGAPLAYDGLQDAPPYLVIGPFGAYTGVYHTGDTLDNDYREIHRDGQYILYQRR